MVRKNKVFDKSLSNLVHDFWEHYFFKPKLLLVANRLIYLNISIVISKIYCPRPPTPYSYLHRITTSGVKIRPVLNKLIFISSSRERG